jgi:hypothetical protein
MRWSMEKCRKARAVLPAESARARLARTRRAIEQNNLAWRHNGWCPFEAAVPELCSIFGGLGLAIEPPARAQSPEHGCSCRAAQSLLAPTRARVSSGLSQRCVGLRKVYCHEEPLGGVNLATRLRPSACHASPRSIRKRSVYLPNLQGSRMAGVPNTHHEAPAPTLSRRHAWLTSRDA